MFDATSLLGGMMQSGMSGSSGNRLQRAAEGTGQGDMLSGLMGGGQGGGGMLGGLMGGGGQGGGMMGGGGGIGGLISSVLGGGGGGMAGGMGGGMMGGGLGGGMMGILGSLAINALQQSSAAGQQAGPAPGQQMGGGQGTSYEPGAAQATSQQQGGAQAPDEQQTAMLLLQAMINAAKADGTVDQTERQKIVGKLDEAGADQEAREWVDRELDGPRDDGKLISQVTSPELGAQVYSASLLAIDVDSEAERSYLRELAQKLNLPQAAVDHIHEQLGVDRQG